MEGLEGIKVIIFDCMETLVEVKEKPDLRLYSSWAYHGSGVEEHWDRFEDFYAGFDEARAELGRRGGKNREYSLDKRFEYLIERAFTGSSTDFKGMLAGKLAANFWSNYRENCFVDPEVRETLAELQQTYRLGVVSNFMISGGIEELLGFFSIEQYFQFVITSIGEGWRKPERRIYRAALKKAVVEPEEVLFIGDDYYCDYQGPGLLGMRTILLDREGNYPETSDRIKHLAELKELLT